MPTFHNFKQVPKRSKQFKELRERSKEMSPVSKNTKLQVYTKHLHCILLEEN